MRRLSGPSVYVPSGNEFSVEWGNLSDDQKQAIEERKRQLKSDRDSLTRDFAVASIAAQNGDTEAMAETERIKGEIADIDEQISGLEKPMNAGEHIASAATSAVAGLERAGLSVASAIDWALGEKSAPWWIANEIATMVTGKESPLTGLNPVTRFKEHGEQESAWWDEKSAEMAEGNSAAEAVSRHTQTMKLTRADRITQYLDLMQNEYRGRTARFVRNGHTYYATFDQNSVRKPILLAFLLPICPNLY